MRKETICLAGGYKPGSGEPRQLPIIQSTTFKYETGEQLAQLFDLKAAGYFYSRLTNPSVDPVAAKICQLEGGVAAMLTSSGQAAGHYAVFNICEAGDHMVLSSKIYGGSYNLYTVTMKKMGIESTVVDPDAPYEELAKAFRPNTKCVMAETLANPALAVLDIEKFAKLAHDHGVPLIVDNTFATPIHCNPIQWGADIVIHSTTKYMEGHGAALGGAIVDSGNFDWEAHGDKFPGLTRPDPSYHGLVYSQAFGKGAYITKAVVQLMRDLGSCQAPQNAYLLNLGLETLALRMERHYANALALAKYLEEHDQVSWVNFPGLESSAYHALAQKYMPKGSCGVISFGLKGGKEAAIRFMDSLNLVNVAIHVADARSCALHPASTTHRQLDEAGLMAAGIQPEMVRLSVGIEHVEDLLEDLEQALGKAAN